MSLKKKIGGGAYEQSSRPPPKRKRLLSLLEKILCPLTRAKEFRWPTFVKLLLKQNIGDNVVKFVSGKPDKQLDCLSGLP